jgi:hypothetical protein
MVEVVVGHGVVVPPFYEGVVEALGYDFVFVAVRAVACTNVVHQLADVASAAEGEVSGPQLGVGQGELALTVGQRDLRLGHH